MLCTLVVGTPLYWGCAEQNTVLNASDGGVQDALLDVQDVRTAPSDSEFGTSDPGSDAEVDGTTAPIEDASTLQFISIDNVDITDGRSERIPVILPDDVESILLYATGQEDVLYAIEHLESPSGELLIAERPPGVEITDSLRRLTPFPGPFASPNRSGSAGLGFASILAPNNPAIRLYGGEWFIQVGALSGGIRTSSSIHLSGLIRRTPPTAESILNLHLFFTGANDWTRESAMTDPRFARALSRMNAVFNDVGVRLNIKSYQNIDDAFRTIDTGPAGPDSPPSTLHQMFEENTFDDGVSLFFVDRIGTAADGGFVAGISGGTPGPGALREHFRGGVAIATEMFEDPSTIGHIMAHETGHYLGLFHTREFLEGITDQLDDTPEDASGDDNLMFPTVTSERTYLSDSQGWVLHRNPLLSPMPEVEEP